MSSSNQRPANMGFRSVLRCAITHYHQFPSLSAPEPYVMMLAVLLSIGSLGKAVPQAEAVGICDRTVQVREAILNQIAGADSCSAVTDADLAAVTGTLNLEDAGLSSLRAGDFSGLTGLQSLYLGYNQLTALPADIFSGLANLGGLRLTKNKLQALPNGVFTGLVNLDVLDLEYNELQTLPVGAFGGLNLLFLGLEANQFQSLPVGVFDSLSVSLALDLSDNKLETLPAGLFAGLGTLSSLDLENNQLETLPAGVFAGLTSLRALKLDGNPGADFTFTMTVTRVPGRNSVVVTVPQGAPFDMRTSISATGGTLPPGVSSVTVSVGHTTSDEIAVVPLEGTTVSLGAAPPVPSEPPSPGSNTRRFTGIASAVGDPVTFEEPSLTVGMTIDTMPPVEGAFTVRFSFSETVAGFTSSDIETQQEPPCRDSGNNPVSCNPTIAALQTTDDRIFTTTVTPRTTGVNHNYTLTISVRASGVTSVVGNKPNEAAALEVRIAPPGATVPISSIGLTASSGNSQVTLRWDVPANTGGAPIVRYEYRWAESGGEFSDWVRVAPEERSATVRNLTNDTEYVFEVRVVNTLGYGMAEPAMATPVADGGGFFPPPPPPPPANDSPTADAGPDQIGVWEGALVTLDGSGSSDPDDDPLRYRWNQFSGEPVTLSSRNVVNPTFTAPQGMTAEAVLSFRLLVTDPSGRFDSDTVTVTVDPEAEPPPPEDWTYYFPHLAVGAGWQTTITYINYSSEEVSCRTEFLSDQGTPLLVSFADRGTVPSRSDVLQPGESVHEETNVELSAPRVAGWARAACSGPVKASLLYRRFEGGVPTGEAGVNAATVPATRFVTFAEQGEGQHGTGVAYANPSDTEADITFTVRDTDGETLANDDRSLSPNGHGAANMVDLFDLLSFTGSLEVTSTQPIVSLSLNNEADPVFSSLPPGELDADAQGSQRMTTYYFPHLAVGAGWQTTITYINYSPQEVSCQTEFLSDHGSPLLVSFAGRGMDISRSDVLPPGGSVHEETNIDLSAPEAGGWARATCSGPVKASLLYRRFEGGVPTGEAGVNATTVPATRFVTFAEQGEGMHGTGVGYANPSNTTTAFVTFTVRDADGQMLARSAPQTLLPRGHGADNMAPLFGLPSFTGWLEITSTAPIVSLSLNNEADPVFSSLPPGDVE